MGRLVIDISNNNPEPNFVTLRKAGVQGVILKATEGVGFEDRTSPGRADRARKEGLRVGFYHFARPSGGDAISEARYFSNYVKKHGGIKRRDYRPALDLEVTRIPYSQLDYWARSFNREVKRLLGVGPLFYSYPSFISQMKLLVPIGYGLWLASYGPNDGLRHAVKPVYPWRHVYLHQYSSRARIAGYGPVDVSYVLEQRGILAHPILGRL